jgi:hypothetical protein
MALSTFPPAASWRKVSHRLRFDRAVYQTHMVFIAYSGGQGPGPAKCQPLPAPRPVASVWDEAAKQQQSGLKLPLFSLLHVEQPSAQPLFRSLQAELQLDEAAWARSSVFCDLKDLQPPADEALKWQLKPQLIGDGSPAAAVSDAPPAFLSTARTPRLDAYLNAANATLDVPIMACRPDSCKDPTEV